MIPGPTIVYANGECAACGTRLLRTTFCGHALRGCPHCKEYWDAEG